MMECAIHRVNYRKLDVIQDGLVVTVHYEKNERKRDARVEIISHVLVTVHVRRSWVCVFQVGVRIQIPQDAIQDGPTLTVLCRLKTSAAGERVRHVPAMELAIMMLPVNAPLDGWGNPVK